VTRRKLFLSHDQYAEMLKQRATALSNGAFVAWAMSRYGLRPFIHYEIVVEAAQQTREGSE
jgi:hypothetical protein